MFKYKSPLSRLLEGNTKTEDQDDALEEERNEAEEEPIADLNALRQVLAGGNQAAEAKEEPAEITAPERAAVAEVKAEDITPVTVEEDIAEVEATAAQTEDAGVDVIVNTILAEDVPNSAGPSIALTEPTGIAEIAPIKVEAAPADAEIEPEEIAEPEPVAVTEPVVEPVPAATPTQAPAAEAEAKIDRSERVKTTFLGFERPDAHVQDSMEAAPVSKREVDQNSFPVGWLVITEGPGRGTSFSLIEGLAQLGRNDDQAIQLDFGDNGISRAGHAVVAYNTEDRTCYLGHGGKANLVRLNGGPVLSTVPLSNGDMIRISDTTLRFVTFCGDNFDWQDK
ncbi:FHA domain-containing protein [Aliiroseovarius halocynthiae]|uniref:FHA domain-containing protein n=1 Tax=Aliiroseovarius halocynthiae TaxID=985055 RepID=A0A545SPP7_9RHOB|nr:FHA domain-containing protein [Aliiroseovarius halocynthiae]TQV66836.1 FHA domain-containing protein [Aliiroseovarius halocynthiae]SMR82327.1 FHA domain-containing protein [Aliiroseovarius halocynthiae]